MNNYKAVRKATEYKIDKINKKRNFTYLNKKFCKENQTVLIGDSITEMYNHTEFFSKYSERTGLDVYNRGISGDTSDRLLERLYDNALNINPKNLVLLIGTNDLGVGADIYFILDNIEKIIDESREACPDINFVLLGVYPVGDRQGRRNNRDIIRLNAHLSRLAKAKEVKYLDLTKELSDQNGKLNSEYTFDGLHLNAYGFEVVTNKLLPLI